MCVRVFLHMCIYLCACLVNTIMQPFSAIAECSKTIKGLTEVLTVDYSGSKSEPGIMKPVCSTKLCVTFNTHGCRVVYGRQHVVLLIPDNIC